MKTFGWLIVFVGLIALLSVQVRAEVLNNDQFGSVEIKDLSVIDKAAGMLTPSGLRFDVSRGGAVYPGDQVTIFYQGVNGMYSTLVDYSPDRKVKPLVMNDLVKISDNQGGLQRQFQGAIGNALGDEYILLITSNKPLDDKRLQDIALAPDKLEIKDDIVAAAVNNFKVVQKYNAPDRSIGGVNPQPVPINNGNMIPLSDFTTYQNYPLNTYPYNPWPYMYLYPYARFQPTQYINTLGPLTETWYVFPTDQGTLKSNFLDYASDAWIDKGIWIVPPGAGWQGTLQVDNPYTPYYLRILPYLARQNTSYLDLLQVQINGTPIKPDMDLYNNSIGYGQYETNNPFAYYNLNSLLHQGINQISISWPQDQTDNFQLQMMDVLPTDVADKEVQQAEDQAQKAQQQNGGNNGSGK